MESVQIGNGKLTMYIIFVSLMQKIQQTVICERISAAPAQLWTRLEGETMNKGIPNSKMLFIMASPTSSREDAHLVIFHEHIDNWKCLPLSIEIV